MLLGGPHAGLVLELPARPAVIGLLEGAYCRLDEPGGEAAWRTTTLYRWRPA